MQRFHVLPRTGVRLSCGTLPGNGPCALRLARPTVAAAATRGDWRSEIEGSSPSGSDAAAAAAPKGSATATATLKPPAAPQAPQAAPAEAPPSPWSAPKPAAAAAAAGPGKPAAAAAAAAGPGKPAKAAAPAAAGPAAASVDSEGPAVGSRGEPISLPTIDLMELLSEPKAQATAFTALAATSAILAVLCSVEPEAVLDFALPKALISDLDVTFVRIVGVTLAASGAVEYSLKHAAESQLLKSVTYQRLMAGCAAKSVGFLVVLVANTPATWRLWNPLLWVAYAATAVGAATINLTVMSKTSGSGLAPPPVDLSPPQNNTAWAYAAFTALYLLTVAACFTPETLFTGDPYSAVTPLVKGVWAPGFMLAAVISYVLKDAADRGRLGASTFKNLNLGLAALEYGYSIIFGSAILSDQVDIDLPALSNLGGALLIATFALYTYATAKK